MSKRKSYTPPRVIRYESKAEDPERTRSIVKTLRQELGVLQFEVEPQYVTVVDSDRRYVEVSDSFCQLVGYQREELVGMRYDDLTAPNTISRASSACLQGSDTCMVCGCSLVVKVPAFWSGTNHGFDQTHTSKGTWRS